MQGQSNRKWKNKLKIQALEKAKELLDLLETINDEYYSEIYLEEIITLQMELNSEIK